MKLIRETLNQLLHTICSTNCSRNFKGFKYKIIVWKHTLHNLNIYNIRFGSVLLLFLFIRLHELFKLIEIEFSILILIEPLKDSVDLCISHLLRRLPELCLGEESVSVSVIGVEGQFGLLVQCGSGVAKGLEAG